MQISDLHCKNKLYAQMGISLCQFLKNCQLMALNQLKETLAGRSETEMLGFIKINNHF